MKIDYEQLAKLQIKDAGSKIIEHSRKRLSELSIFDLILDEDKENSHVHGVYLFFSPNSEVPLYIGKVSSPQFIERLPAHFAIGEGSWSNQFLKAHRKALGAESLSEAALDAKTCELLLILSSPLHSEKLEAILIRLLNPIYNVKKPKAGIDFTRIDSLKLEEIVEPNKSLAIAP